MRQWRLIVDSPRDGGMNMAIDTAILQAVAASSVPPTLRLYRWEPPCLSLGYAQPLEDVDLERLHAHGWGLVRRPTGGRAILHTEELTYSVCVPAAHPLAAGTVVDSYRRISMALLAALGQLGASPHADRLTERIRGHSQAVCFETPSHYEITVQGRKLVGSAQARRGGGVLQHGTLPLTGDVARICDALVFADETAREQAKAHVRARALTLAEALGGLEIGWRTAALTLAEAFARAFDLTLMPATLTADEQAAAQQIASETYNSPAWTARVSGD